MTMAKKPACLTYEYTVFILVVNNFFFFFHNTCELKTIKIFELLRMLGFFSKYWMRYIFSFNHPNVVVSHTTFLDEYLMQKI